MQEFYSSDDRIEVRLAGLLKLEEQRDAALQQFFRHQAIVKCWFDKRAKIRAFKISDLVLLWDKASILGENAFRLSSIIGEPVPLPVNGQFLKQYFGS